MFNIHVFTAGTESCALHVIIHHSGLQDCTRVFVIYGGKSINKINCIDEYMYFNMVLIT